MPQHTPGVSEGRTPSQASAWGIVLLVLFMLLGGHSPPSVAANPLLLPDSRDLHWSESYGDQVATREQRAISAVKISSGGGHAALPPTVLEGVEPTHLPVAPRLSASPAPPPRRHALTPPPTGPPSA